MSPDAPAPPRGFLTFESRTIEKPIYVRATAIDAVRDHVFNDGATIYLRGGLTTQVDQGANVILAALAEEDARI